MANIKSNITKRGRKPKKSLAGSASDVLKSSTSNSVNSHLISGLDKNAVNHTSGIITRSGRIRKKSKDSLKAMNTILKSELMIEVNKKQSPKKVPDSPTSNGNNNNDISITDQNNTELSLTKNSEESPRRFSKRSPKNNSNKLPSENLVGKIRVARNIFQNDANEHKDTKSSKASNAKDILDNTHGFSKMEEGLRENVISNMITALSPNNDLIDPDEPKKRKRTRNNKSPVERVKEIKEKLKKQKTDINSVDKAKTKQVRLSNGVVLTLSLVQCDHCKKAFSNKASLSRHMLSHFDIKPHQCQHCPRKFRYRSTLKLHLERRHPITQNPVEFHVCHICDKTFQLEENLELHLASHIKTENNFKCLYCDKKFSYRLLLIQHEKTHTDASNTNRFKCYICDMTYDSRSRLASHLKSHSKDYICQHCGKEFQRLNSIKRHVRVCHGGHTIKCPICHKDLKGHLTEHMRVHNQNRPHICPECGQRFTQSTQLKVHRRSHTGDRPYICRICNRPFGHSNALLLHIRRHTGEKPFPCAMCHLTFNQLPHMKAHMNKIHGKSCAYKCQKCKEFFKLKCELESHMKGCTVGDRQLTFEEQIQASVQMEEIEVESVMSLSKMRYLLALLLTMIASKEKLKYLGFNKRLIDDLLEESLEAMGHIPCNDKTLSPLKRLKKNIETLLEGTIPKYQMQKFRSENKTTEELLVLLTDEKTNGKL